MVCWKNDVKPAFYCSRRRSVGLKAKRKEAFFIQSNRWRRGITTFSSKWCRYMNGREIDMAIAVTFPRHHLVFGQKIISLQICHAGPASPGPLRYRNTRLSSKGFKLIVYVLKMSLLEPSLLVKLFHMISYFNSSTSAPSPRQSCPLSSFAPRPLNIYVCGLYIEPSFLLLSTIISLR